MDEKRKSCGGHGQRHLVFHGFLWVVVVFACSHGPGVGEKQIFGLQICTIIYICVCICTCIYTYKYVCVCVCKKNVIMLQYAAISAPKLP